MSIFVDFIRIKQRHPGKFNPETLELEASLPLVDEGIIGKFPRSDDTGEYTEDAEWAMQTSRKIRGSFDSLVIVKCDGFNVSLEGNIGRLDRPDNLFNLDFDATLQKCNEVLARFGLPPFTAGEKVINPNPSAYDIKQGLFEYWTGATISQLHLTLNYSAGSPNNAQAVIDWLSTQSMSRIKRGRAGETTVQWGSKGGRKLLKAYIKHVEMLVHRHGRKKPEILLDPVYQFCLANGIVRFELEANRLLLRDNMLRFLGDITMEKLIQLFNEEVNPLLQRTREDVTRFELETLPASVRVTAAAYLRGENVRALMSKATFYRHANQLREYGIDIAEPLLSISKFTSVIKVIELQPVNTVPDFYWHHQRVMSFRAVENQMEAA